MGNYEYNQNIIKPTAEMPIKLFSFEATDTKRIKPRHWHQGVQIMYCVEGRLDVWINDKKYELKEGDFFYINPNEVHENKSPQKNKVISLQIPISVIKKFIKNDMYIHCNTFECSDRREELQNIKDILLDMYNILKEKSSGYELMIYSNIFKLGHILINNFTCDNQYDLKLKSQKHLERLSLISEYIQEHYREQITLNEIAYKFGYTPQYLARYFKKYIGVTFLEYLYSVRLDKAYKQLISTDLDIISIAENNGFPTVKAFRRVFKSTYKNTPKAYRRNFRM